MGYKTSKGKQLIRLGIDLVLIADNLYLNIAAYTYNYVKCSYAYYNTVTHVVKLV